MKSKNILSKEKIFILLNEYSKPNPILDYGLELAAKMRFSASLLAFKEKEFQPAMSLVSAGLSPYSARSMDIFAEKVEPIPVDPNLSQLNSKLWGKLQYELGRESSLKQVLELIRNDNDTFLVLIEGNDPKHKLQELFGTFDTKLAAATDLPVLILPSSSRWEGVEKLLYVMDAEDINRSNLKIMHSLGKRLDASLEVIMISEEAIGQSEGDFLSIREEIRNELPDIQLSLHKIYGEKRLEEVKNLIKATGADWLVFEKKDRSLYDRLFDDYNSHKLIQESPIPCLVF